MKPGRNQLELQLQAPQQCRSLHRTKRPSPARRWFEKMRQVVDGAADRPPAEVAEAPPSSR
jgi:hypothetical protein